MPALFDYEVGSQFTYTGKNHLGACPGQFSREGIAIVRTDRPNANGTSRFHVIQAVSHHTRPFQVHALRQRPKYQVTFIRRMSLQTDTNDSI